MATTPDLHEPQIAAARAAAWHQAGDALLTLEAARTWLNERGLILFAARPALGAPAPSLVEATLGTAKEGASAVETSLARTLVARLVGEGSAVPLNLLGGAGDTPDFLVSASAFPFVFTLRGDKGWKRPPETTGPVKVSPLALHVYDLLAERGGALPVAEIVSEIGREVNESAVSRALAELWQMVRVLPVLQQGEGETRWELTTARFLKAVKAGANAGQPTALSALISLYLGQALVATEEEVAGFLSPLTARSRVRDVLHGLSAGRQLEEGVLNGKTVLFVPGTLPDFAQFAPPAAEPAEADADGAPAGEPDSETKEPRPRIRQFGGEGGGPAKDRSLRGKPVPDRSTRAPADRSRRPFPSDRGETGRGRAGGEGRPFTPRAPRSDRGDAPAGGARPPRADRPPFARPWDEERPARPPRREGEGERARPFRARTEGPPRPPRDAGGSGAGRSSGDRPSQDRPFRDRGDDRANDRGNRGDNARPGRPFRASGPPRGEGRPPFREPRSGFGQGDRPSSFPRRSFGAGAADDGSGSRGDRPARPFRPRSDAAEGGPPKRPFRPRTEGGEREGGSSERPFRPRPAAGGREGGFKSRTGAGGAPGGSRPDRPRTDRPRGAEGGSDRSAGRPARPSFGRKTGDRPGGGGAGGGFAPRSRPADRIGGGPGAFRPRAGGKPGGGSSRPDRPARAPRAPRAPGAKRPEDEA